MTLGRFITITIITFLSLLLIKVYQYNLTVKKLYELQFLENKSKFLQHLLNERLVELEKVKSLRILQMWGRKKGFVSTSKLQTVSRETR